VGHSENLSYYTAKLTAGAHRHRCFRGTAIEFKRKHSDFHEKDRLMNRAAQANSAADFIAFPGSPWLI